MGNFFVNTFLKNPVGLIVLGFILIAATYGAIGIAGPIIGVVITVIGFIWHSKSKKQKQAAMAIFTPIYIELVNILKNSGYEVDEFENKKDRIRTSVRLNGNNLGEIFLVAPPPGGKYAQFRRIEDMTNKDFTHNYYKKYRKNPGIATSYWPDNSLIGASIDWYADNCEEKGKWLTDVKNILQEKLPK